MAGTQKAFEKILTILHRQTGVDFSLYKEATLRRRMERRMTGHKLKKLDQYATFLHGRPNEVKAIFNDVLINVTGFFRDPEAFKALKKDYFAQLLRGNKTAETPVRIWVPACSTGEEVYSLAIVLMEVLGERKSSRPVQLFGTDINEAVLDKARAAVYPASIRKQVSAERLRRFFEPVKDGYRINKAIRNLCVFARHNLVVDPPFSNIDLVSCRNVLIYMDSELQRKVMPVFHFALR